ncbi:MAG TPA: hypothetical protein VEF05_01360 [Terriglobales bacterium]|nr:hypothetical protein [Terriglobales bacterium]
MKLHLSDSGRAAFGAVCLFGVAAYAVFGFQHGFEEQVGWYITLLPGAIVAAGISDIVTKIAPSAEFVTFWGLLVCFNLVWYFGISFVAIKAYRFVAKASTGS